MFSRVCKTGKSCMLSAHLHGSAPEPFHTVMITFICLQLCVNKALHYLKLSPSDECTVAKPPKLYCTMVQLDNFCARPKTKIFHRLLFFEFFFTVLTGKVHSILLSKVWLIIASCLWERYKVSLPLWKLFTKKDLSSQLQNGAVCFNINFQKRGTFQHYFIAV